MNNKMIFGLLLCAIGTVFSLFCLACAVSHPVIYNGIGGLYGSLLGTDTLIPFILSLAVMLLGIGICFAEAYRKK